MSAVEYEVAMKPPDQERPHLSEPAAGACAIPASNPCDILSACRRALWLERELYGDDFQ